MNTVARKERQPPPPDRVGRGVCRLAAVVLAALLFGGGAAAESREGAPMRLVRIDLAEQLCEGGPAGCPEGLVITRHIDTLWEFAISEEQSSNITTRYEVVGADGTPGVFSDRAGESLVPVEVEPLGIRRVEMIDGTDVISEGVELRLDLGQLDAAREFGGQVTAVVTLTTI